MRFILTSVFLSLGFGLFAQADGEIVTNYEALPIDVFTSLQEETNAVDVSFFPPSTKSISFNGQNAKLFLDFVQREAPTTLQGEPMGFIMFLVDGEMIVSGNIYMWDEDQGAFEFTYDNKKCYQSISAQGVGFMMNNK